MSRQLPMDRHSPSRAMCVRVVPFLIFLALTLCQGKFGEASRYWFYAGKTLVGAGMIWAVYPWISEMRWRLSLDAVVVGLVVLVAWVGLDGWYPSIEKLSKAALCPVASHVGLDKWCTAPVQEATPWNPHTQFGSSVAWAFILIRLLGSTFVVPPLEEAFYRSYLYRYIIRPDFEAVPLNTFRWLPWLLGSAIFGLAHYEWLPGFLCGLLYQGLVLRHNRLGEAMTAHAITNFLLGVWIIYRGAWHFW